MQKCLFARLGNSSARSRTWLGALRREEIFTDAGRLNTPQPHWPEHAGFPAGS